MLSIWMQRCYKWWWHLDKIREEGEGSQGIAEAPRQARPHWRQLAASQDFKQDQFTGGPSSALHAAERNDVSREKFGHGTKPEVLLMS